MFGHIVGRRDFRRGAGDFMNPMLQFLGRAVFDNRVGVGNDDRANGFTTYDELDLRGGRSLRF
jgi:hypothetical protein